MDPLRLVCYLPCTKAAIRALSWAPRIVSGRSQAGRREGISRKRWEGGADEQEWEQSRVPVEGSRHGDHACEG
jgi:hypothetical protein